MSCKIYNKTNSDFGELNDHIQDMYGFFAKKYSFDKSPSVHLKSDEQNKAEILGKTAYYDPQSFEVHIYTDDRHPKDILRSIAHELIHHKQNLEQRLEVGGYNGPGYYLENDDLKEVEHEAMLEGNACMREWEDTRKYKENKDMSLKEWKNNELNKLLLERWGILSEAKKKKPDFLDVDEDGDKKESFTDAVKDKKIKNKMPKKGKGNDNDDDKPPKGGPAGGASAEDEKEAVNEEKDCLDEACGDYEKMKEIRNPRSTNEKDFVGHEDRYRADRMNEDYERYQSLRGKKDRTSEEEKELRDLARYYQEERVSESRSRSLQESIKRLARAKKVFFRGRRVK